MNARDHLAVALDVASLQEAERLIERLAGVPGWLKVGAELFTVAGPAAVRAAAAHGRVFLDTKLHDIPNTVARSVAAATRHGVGMLTLHASGGAEMMRAAREGVREAAAAEGCEPPALIAVTLLTSLSPADLKDLGIAVETVEDQIARLVDLAVASGMDGVVASPREAALVRRRGGKDLRIITPGIRPADWGSDDQARTATAKLAIEAGADVIVVGRPVVAAADPGEAARRFAAEIEQGLAARRT